MSPIITREEVKKHNNERDIWIIIHNEVYDVTKFLDEHPGGADSLMDFAGKDGTQGFEDVGHSDDARVLMKQFRVGQLDSREHTKTVDPWTSTKGKNDCIVCQAASCGPVPKDDKKEKSWRTFDGSRDSKPKLKSEMKSPTTPRAEPRVQTIVVPRERRPRGPPCEGSSKLKWAIFALGAAILIGIAVKKYMA